MKKTLFALLFITALLCGCSSGKTDTPDTQPTAGEASDSAPVSVSEIDPSEIIEITEKMFIAQVNDIYLNADDYLGKPIKYQGVFESYFHQAKDNTYCYIFRYGPGCCGDDGNVGFEVVYDGEYPQAYDWVEVLGVLESYEEFGTTFLRLRAVDLITLPQRGQENVEQ